MSSGGNDFAIDSRPEPTVKFRDHRCGTFSHELWFCWTLPRLYQERIMPLWCRFGTEVTPIPISLRMLNVLQSYNDLLSDSWLSDLSSILCCWRLLLEKLLLLCWLMRASSTAGIPYLFGSHRWWVDCTAWAFFAAYIAKMAGEQTMTLASLGVFVAPRQAFKPETLLLLLTFIVDRIRCCFLAQSRQVSSRKLGLRIALPSELPLECLFC